MRVFLFMVTVMLTLLIASLKGFSLKEKAHKI